MTIENILPHGLKKSVYGSQYKQEYDENLDLLDPDRTTSGLLADRTAAGVARRFYYATDTKQLFYDNGASWDEIIAPGGTGEANTVSNVGTGVGLFKQKSGIDLELRKINAASTRLSVGAPSDEVLLDVNEVNLDHGSIGGLGGDDHPHYARVSAQAGVPDTPTRNGELNVDTTAGVAHVGINGAFKEIVDTSSTQTLADKTLTAPLIDAIHEKTVGNGVAVDGLTIKDGGFSGMTGAPADGDIYVRSGGKLERIAKGTANQTLRQGASIPEWFTDMSLQGSTNANLIRKFRLILSTTSDANTINVTAHTSSGRGFNISSNIHTGMTTLTKGGGEVTVSGSSGDNLTKYTMSSGGDTLTINLAHAVTNILSSGAFSFNSLGFTVYCDVQVSSGDITVTLTDATGAAFDACAVAIGKALTMDIAYVVGGAE